MPMGIGKLYVIAGANASNVRTRAHARGGGRCARFFDEIKSSGLPIAKTARDQIGALFDVKWLMASAPPDHHERARTPSPN